jgi:hypothetical protein
MRVAVSLRRNRLKSFVGSLNKGEFLLLSLRCTDGILFRLNIGSDIINSVATPCPGVSVAKVR